MAEADARREDTRGRVAALRKLMAEAEGGPLDAYLVPSEDAHQSEYVTLCDQRRAFISGFTGSAGLALVTTDDCRMWTDGRYFAQALNEMRSEWTLMKIMEDIGVEQWIGQNLPEGARVGADFTCLSIDAARRLEHEMHAKHQQLVQVDGNLVDIVWGEERPAAPVAPLRVQPLKYAGVSAGEKVQKIREKLESAGAYAIVFTALDEVAWLYNIRGGDVPFNPVAVAYAIVTTSTATLFVDPRKVTPEVSEHLKENQIEVKPYSSFFTDLAALAKEVSILAAASGAAADGAAPPAPADAANGAVAEAAASGTEGTPGAAKPKATGRRVWICPSTCSYAVHEKLKQGLSDPSLLLLTPSPVTLAKALKNKAELDGMRASHIRDAVALVNFFCWLDSEMQSRMGAPGYFLEEGTATGAKRKSREGDAADPDAKRQVHENGSRAPGGPAYSGIEAPEELDECTAADVLEEFRKQQDLFMGPSFDTISSVGPNAAIIHYKPKPEACARLSPSEIYLCDSGGQYLDGTTDCTRTMHFGKPSAHEKRCFTLVLKGYIALERIIFPNGTTGAVLDVLARQPLWTAGLDYRHGTGHGVGSYLNVHEGPHLISFRPRAQVVPLQASMTVTDEPGYYEDGHFGIRTENVLIVKDHECAHNFGNKGFLALEPVTFVPIQQKLIDVSMLTSAELEWLNTYHEECRAKLAPLLSETAKDWLIRATEPLKA